MSRDTWKGVQRISTYSGHQNIRILTKEEVCADTIFTQFVHVNICFSVYFCRNYVRKKACYLYNNNNNNN